MDMSNARCNKSIRDEISAQEEGEVISELTILLEDRDNKIKIDEAYRLMILMLETNVLFNGIRVELNVIESLLRWEITHGDPHEFVLSKIGEHVELSDWLAGHIRKQNEGTHYFETATDALEEASGPRLSHEVALLVQEITHEMIHQTGLPKIRAIKELDSNTGTINQTENETEEPKIERRLGKDPCACPACDKTKE